MGGFPEILHRAFNVKSGKKPQFLLELSSPAMAHLMEFDRST